MSVMRVEEIRVGNRARKDYRDMAALVASIAERGLLQPLGVWPDGTLACGGRRLTAVQQLGWETVPVHILTGLDDLVSRLKAERDENTCRFDLLPTEAVAQGIEIERLEREAAKQRQARGRKQGSRYPCSDCGEVFEQPVWHCPVCAHHWHEQDTACPNCQRPRSGKFPEREERGQTRDKVAEAVGMSGKTYEKAKAVTVNGCEELKEAMDSGTVSVSAAAAIACLPQDEQREVLAEGPEAAVERAKEIKEERKRSREAVEVKHSHSDRLYAWQRSVAVETEVIDLRLGGIESMLADREKWDWSVVRGQILPALEDLEKTISRYRKEIENAVPQKDT